MNSRTHRPHAAWQWNPPPMPGAADDSLRTRREVQSHTECTGLMQHVPEDESEAHALSNLYGIHPVKPKNPANPSKKAPAEGGA